MCDRGVDATVTDTATVLVIDRSRLLGPFKDCCVDSRALNIVLSRASS
jgi:hypothetical protein